MNAVKLTGFILLCTLVGACYHNEFPTAVMPSEQSKIIVSLPKSQTAVTNPTTNTLTYPASLSFLYDEGPIVNPPATSRIKSTTITYNEYLSESVIQEYVKNPSKLKTAQYSQTYNQEFTYNENGQSLQKDQTIVGNLLIGPSYKKGELSYSDTAYLNKSGYIISKLSYWIPGRNPETFVYDPESFLINEEKLTINACLAVSYFTLKQKHTIENGNRIKSEIVSNEISRGETRSIEYEFDVARLNTKTGFSLFKIASGCSGNFLYHGNPYTELHGKLNKNLIRKAYISNNKGDMGLLRYLYSFDKLGRVKTMTIISYRKYKVWEYVHEAYGLDLIEYDYY
jgi:hypothetical protein